MRHQLDPAIVRIANEVGTAAGLGVLVGEGVILTCTHVVRDALGLKETPANPPAADLTLDFPLAGGDTAGVGRVFLWRPEVDIAGLALAGPPPATARPISLVTAGDLWGHTFRAFGFPQDRGGGVWAGGVMRGSQAQGWLQIDTGPGGYHVEPGFSGGPVWDDALEGVVGLVTRSDPKAGVRAAYVIPTPELIQAWSDLAATSRPPSPYRGLAAFRAADAGNFFGREATTARLREEVNRKSLLAVVGPSGSGKSSVVFAGLVPALQSDGWLVIDFRPSRAPFASLATALLPHLEPDLTEVDRLVETSKLAAALEEGTVGLVDVLDRIFASANAARVLLIADQFEELYALGDDLPHRHCFLDALLALPSDQPSPHRFTLCITLRADFMGQALAYRPFADALQDHDLKLGPMNRDELRAAVEQPAAHLHVAFKPGLVDRILDDVGQEPGNLPLLEFALTLLWERQRLGHLTHEAYQAIDQVQGALANHAETIFEGLNADEQDAARHIFVQLVQPGAGTADTRRLATREEVGDANWPLVQQLAGERLLTTSGDEGGGETVEVAHEALIQQWEQLRTWIAEDRTFREWQERLRVAMAMWQASHWDVGALLRGPLLADAEVWLATRGRDLPRRERQYISAGIAAREALAREEEGRLRKELAMVGALAKEQARASRGLRRRSIVALIVAAVALLAAAGAIYFWTQAERGRRLAEAREFAARSLEVMERDPDQSLLLAYRAALGTLAQGEPVAGEVYRALHIALTRLGRPLAVLGRHSSLFVQSAAFSPDGTRVVTAGGDNTARLWDTNGQPLAVLQGHADSVYSAAFSSDGSRIVTSSNDGTARLWDGAGRPLAVLKGHTDRVHSAFFSPNGAHIITTSWDGTGRLWDAAGQPLAVLEGHTNTISSAAFSPDGSRIITADNDGNIRLWDGDGGPLSVFEGHTGGVMSAAFSPDGHYIVTTSLDGTARLWDSDGRPLAVLEGHTAGVLSAAFSPDGTRIVTAGQDDTARLWNGDGLPLAILKGHIGIVYSAAFSSDGTRIVTASADGTSRLWAANGELLGVLKGHTDRVVSAAFNLDGTRILTTGWEGTARLWDGIGQPLAVIAGHTNGVNSASYNPDGTRIVTTSWDGTARVWNGDGQPMAILEGHADELKSAMFSPDGTLIITASGDGTARLWHSDGHLLAVLEGHTGVVQLATFSPDGTRIVTASIDGTARLWNTSGQPLAILEHSSGLTSAAFSPDGKRIVTASTDGTAHLWDEDGQPLGVLEGHSGWVNSAIFNSDGTLIVTASDDNTARLWDGDGHLLAVLEGHSGWVQSATFSSDGKRVVTASRDGTVRLWDSNGQLLATLEGHTDLVRSAAFSANGQRIITASNDGTARLWNDDGQTLTIFEGHTDLVWSAVFSPDDTRIVTTSSDGTARIWQTYPTVEAMLAEAEQILSHILPYEQCLAELGEALCVTPDELP